MSLAFTPAPWVIKFRNDHSAYISLGDPVKGPHKQFDIEFDDRYPSDVADARLITELPALYAIADRLGKLADGLANSNSGAEDAAADLAEDARALVRKINGGA